jgi:hypothetical protein
MNPAATFIKTLASTESTAILNGSTRYASTASTR